MRQEIAFIDFLFGVLLNLDGFVERLSIHSQVFLRVVGLRTSEIFPLLEAFLITKFFITTSTAYSFTKMTLLRMLSWKFSRMFWKYFSERLETTIQMVNMCLKNKERFLRLTLGCCVQESGLGLNQRKCVASRVYFCHRLERFLKVQKSIQRMTYA